MVLSIWRWDMNDTNKNHGNHHVGGEEEQRQAQINMEWTNKVGFARLAHLRLDAWVIWDIELMFLTFRRGYRYNLVCIGALVLPTLLLSKP